MSLLLKQIFQFIKLLNSDTGANQIATGIACGVILGFAPVFSLQTVLVIICLFFFRIQIGAATVTAFFFAFAGWLLDPVFHEVGAWALQLDGLQSAYTSMYNMPIVPLTKFYNSIVMGSAVTTVILAPAVFFLAKYLVRKYREQIVARFKSTKFWKAVQLTGFYKWYLKYEELHG